MSGHTLQTAVLRAESSERDAAFKFDTCMLTPEQQQRCMELQAHGFIAVEAPQDWRHCYPPSRWKEEVIKRAMDIAGQVAARDSGNLAAGYDAQLAATILTRINDVYPRAVTLMELRHRMNNEPSDDAFVAALAALSGDGYIDTMFDSRTRRLAPLREIKITKEGRRHLEDMARKVPRSSQKGFTANDASQFILAQLLDEFRQRKLTSHDLRNTYQGLSPAELKNRAVSEGISDVDFDLAMSDLDSHEMVKTGPMKLYDQEPYSPLTVIGFYSKNQYSYLTEEGYKEATRTQSRNPTTSHKAPIIHGDQYINYGHAGAIGPQSTGTIKFQQQWNAIHHQVDLPVLTNELEQLRKHLQQSASSSADFQQLGLLADAEQHAKKKDGSKVLDVLSKVGKGTLDVATTIGTEVAAKVIAKAMGLQP